MASSLSPVNAAFFFVLVSVFSLSFFLPLVRVNFTLFNLSVFIIWGITCFISSTFRVCTQHSSQAYFIGRRTFPSLVSTSYCSRPSRPATRWETPTLTLTPIANAISGCATTHSSNANQIYYEERDHQQTTICLNTVLHTARIADNDHDQPRHHRGQL